MAVVAVTGANGFVGRTVCAELANRGHDVRPVVRRGPEGDGRYVVQDSADADAWADALTGVTTVVHLIGRTHALREQQSAAAAMAAYRRTNVDITRAVLDASKRVGVARLIYVSSIKAVGESSPTPYDESAPCHPQDAYGVTKLAAEEVVRSASGALSTVVLRPPLVYGPGVKGNVARLLGAIAAGRPLPLGRADARRSMVFVGNLADAVAAVVAADVVPSPTYHVTDGDDRTVREFVQALATGLGSSARLLPVPPRALRLVGRALGRRDEIDRLVSPLVVDSSRLRRELHWSPPFTVDEGAAETARSLRAADRA